MPTAQVTPLSQIDQRAPEAGRIRMGVKTVAKNGKPSMKATETFRFTSPKRELIEQLAQLYGGKVLPWEDDKANPRNQWQLQSTVNAIPVLCVPGGVSVNYEMWTARSCKRRCDGVTVVVPEQTGPSDYELISKPCLCDQEGALSCKRYTRLTVVLPDISFAGTWRLESKGKAASEELVGMANFISAVTVQGRMVRAILSMEFREKMTEGGPRHFVVPQLALEDTPNALAAGASTLAIGSGPVVPPTLTLGTGAALSTENTPIDAEMLEEGQIEAEELLHADAINFGFDPDAYVAAVKANSMVDGRLSVKWMLATSRNVRAELIVPFALVRGRIVWHDKDGKIVGGQP